MKLTCLRPYEWSCTLAMLTDISSITKLFQEFDPISYFHSMFHYFCFKFEDYLSCRDIVFFLEVEQVFGWIVF